MLLKRQAFGFTVFLGALSALPPLSIDMGLPGIPAIEASFTNAVSRGPLTLSVFLAGFAISPLLCGPLADRFGRKLMLQVGLAILSVAAIACAMAQSFSALLAFRCVQGFAAGACVIIPLAIIRDVFEGTVARQRMSQVTAVLGIAPMLAPLLGGWVMIFGGWRAIYAAQAVTALILLVVTSVGFAETLPAERRRLISPALLVSGYRHVLSSRAFVGNTLVYALGFACMFSFISGSPSVMMDTFGLSRHAFSLLFGLTSCGVLLGALSSGWLSHRNVASARVMVSGLSLMIVGAVALLALVLSGEAGIATTVLLVAVTIFGFGVMAPSSNHEAMRDLPHMAGAASGMLRCTQMVMGAIASALIATFEPLGHAPLNMAGLMVAAVIAAALVYVVLVRLPQNGSVMDQPRPA